MSVLDKLNIYTLLEGGAIPVDEVYKLGNNVDFNDFDIKDFLAICPEFKSLFDSNESNRYNMLFSVYRNQGIKVITSEYEDNRFICLCWYIAHNLQIALSNMKNNNNLANLNSTTLPQNLATNQGVKDSKGKTEMSLARDLARTTYGQNLFEIMKFIGKSSIMGVY